MKKSSAISYLTTKFSMTFFIFWKNCISYVSLKWDVKFRVKQAIRVKLLSGNFLIFTNIWVIYKKKISKNICTVPKFCFYWNPHSTRSLKDSYKDYTERNPANNDILDEFFFFIIIII